MVRFFTFISVLILVCFALQADVSKVELALDQTTLPLATPIQGSILVTHDKADKIDLSSITYRGKTLKVETLHKVDIGPTLVVETLRFELEPLPMGLQEIKPITIKVGKEKLATPAASVEVKSPSQAASYTPSNIPKKGGVENIKPLLKLEVLGPGPGPFYPGQRLEIGYKYTFQGDIELRQEQVPLLEQTDFTKLGEKKIIDEQVGTVSTRQVTQNIELGLPGTYILPKSLISGYAYLDRGWGPKTYFEPLLVSETPPMTVEIKPFPESQKPPFFEGTLGPFTVEQQVIVPPTFNLGDKITVKLTYKGSGQLATLKPPILLCQPGFSGFFTVGDLPPEGKQKPGEVSYAYEVCPLNLLVHKLPPIYLAYFDPTLKFYKILQTEGFDYQIQANSRVLEKIANPQSFLMKADLISPKPLGPLPGLFSAHLPFSSAWVLLMIPGSLFAYFLRLTYQQAIEEKKLRPLPLVEGLQQAEKVIKDRELFFARAEAILKAQWGPGTYPVTVQRYKEKLDSAKWGAVKPTSFEEYFKELKDLCMPTGKQM